MLLSIVMMIKNEEKLLEKTLKALKPLMKNINSELIILDTGSTDNSVEIAKKYTDKVYFEKWNNDFAHMRNVSISYASGDWLLILDADEELVNYEKLIDFLKSDLHTKYNSATIKLKNIFSEDEKRYNISPLLRMFKNDEDFKYKGKIHEQPLFKKPIYNEIAFFNHYGYLFENEELKQIKDSRNKKILLEEINDKPNDPYINYQLGKNYIISGNFEDALYYMEKGYEIYEKLKLIPLFVIQDLASLYISLSEFIKCEKLCTKYIKSDNKNIDMYYYLATSQKHLSKYKQSIENYNRYLYLLDNYEITTQANNSEAILDTLVNKEECKINIIDICYKLENYEEVIKRVEGLKEESLKEVFSVAIISLYKLNKEEEIINIYNRISGSDVQENEFKITLESTLKFVKEKDIQKIYNVFTQLNGSYKVLNEIRLGKKLDVKQYNNLLKIEKDVYYADILYYAFRDKLDIYELLNGVDYLKMQGYINYLVQNKRDIIVDLYKYIENAENTLDIYKMQIYACISKALLLSGNLIKEKYEKLFLLYINYNYECIKQIYNSTISDIDLVDILRNKEDKFVVEVKNIDELKNNDKLGYLRKLKDLAVNNIMYKKAIEILISKFEEALNESEELKELKIKYKRLIENSINSSRIAEALTMIREYESIFGEEAEILNMKAVISLLQNDLNESEKLLKKSWILDSCNFNSMFNIAYLKELKGDFEEAKRFYIRIIDNCTDIDVVEEAKSKINLL